MELLMLLGSVVMNVLQGLALGAGFALGAAYMAKKLK